MNQQTVTIHDARIGDIVSVQKGLFTHVGVVAYNGILQNSPGSCERIVSWAEFVQGRPWTLTRTNMEAWLVLHRVEKILAAPRAYDALSQNCEHTVNEVVYGQAKSSQVGGVVAGALLGLALVGIFAE